MAESKAIFLGLQAAMVVLLFAQLYWLPAPAGGEQGKTGGKKAEDDWMGLLFFGILICLVAAQVYWRPRPAQEEQASKIDELALFREQLSPAAEKRSADTYVLENSLLRVEVAARGGQPGRVVLKQYKNGMNSEVVLLGGEGEQVALRLPAGEEQWVSCQEVDFHPVPSGGGPDQLQLEGVLPSGRKISLEYRLPGGYQLSCSVREGDKAPASAQLLWHHPVLKQEQRHNPADTYVYYGTDTQSTSYLSRSPKRTSCTVPTRLRWLSVRQKFFNASIFSEEPFSVEKLLWKAEAEDSPEAVSTDLVATSLRLGGNQEQQEELRYSFYFGPNDYFLLKGLAPGMEDLHHLGPRLVKQVNRYICLPVAYWLHPQVGHFLLVLLIILLLLHLLQAPFAWASYRSDRKKKLLAPRVKALYARYGEDEAGAQMAENQLYYKMGLTPLSMLASAFLQLPVMLALMSFTRYTIGFRQLSFGFRQLSFLWIPDVSSYDVFIQLPFRVPLLGDHISCLAMATALMWVGIGQWKKSEQKGEFAQAMAYAGYFTLPISFCVSNGLPAAWHIYQICNKLVSLSLEGVFSLFIDEKKLEEEISVQWQQQEEGGKKPRAQARFERRLRKERK